MDNNLEMKFRAISKETNKVYYNDTKFDINDPDSSYMGFDLILDILDEMWGGSSFGSKERYIIQQYTGMNDKNGKEIWAGDTCTAVWVDSEPVKGTVVFDDGAFCLFINGYQIPPLCDLHFIENLGYETKEK